MGLELPVRQFIKRNKFISKKNYIVPEKFGKKVVLPRKLTKDLCRIIGILQGDGNISNGRILVVDKSIGFHKVLKSLFKETFNINPNLFHDKKRHTYYSHFKSKIVYKFLKEMFELEEGRKKNLKVPTRIQKAPWKYKLHYIGGLFDAEAHVRKRQAEIDFSISSKNIFDFIQLGLRHIKIKYSTYVRKRRHLPEYEIRIYGKKNLLTFQERIKFYHPEKILMLMKVSTR